MLKSKLLGATAGAKFLAVEEVFQSYLYTGNGSTQTITNGIDLAGEGGLVWVKCRSAVTSHVLFDTERGPYDALLSNSTGAELNLNPHGVTSFGSAGFSLSDISSGINGVNGSPGGLYSGSSATYASWTFRKAPRFFDVVTYTGTGGSRTVAHNLGTTVGCLIVKRTDISQNWYVYHRGVNFGATQFPLLLLNTTAAASANKELINSTEPTSTEFSVASDLNTLNGTYVAYLFAHDPLGPSGDGSDGLIACGSYTGNGSTNGPEINLGWEPQWVLIKEASFDGNWQLFDNMRGMVVDGVDARLAPNLSSAEDSIQSLSPLPTGFKINTTSGNLNTSGSTHIYIAIRRGPMREPTVGTQVLSIKNYAATTTSAQVTHDVTFDVEINANRDFVTSKFLFCDSLRGINGTVLATSATSGENSFPTYWSRRDQRTMHAPSAFDAFWASSSGTNNHISYGLVRAPGFFDAVAYTGTGANRTVSHNLGAVPELMIVKKRSATDDWAVYYGDNTDYMLLNSSAATVDDITYWNDTSPTSTVFTVGTNTDVNTNTATYIAYLFATLPGVSKVGTYTGNGSSQTINCGFTGGARFVLIKRTDSTGDWYVWDTARGIVAGNDPFLELNTTDAEVTNVDNIDPASVGFVVNQDSMTHPINLSGASYIYLAIS